MFSERCQYLEILATVEYIYSTSIGVSLKLALEGDSK